MEAPGELASRGRRLGGAIIDSLVIFITTIVLLFGTALIFPFSFWDRAIEEQSTITDLLIILGIGGGGFLAVNGWLLASRGQTVGKMLLAMRIVSVSDGRIPSLGKILALRYLPFWLLTSLPYVGSLLALVNALWIFGEERRCLHDLLAGTKVVMTAKESA